METKIIKPTTENLEKCAAIIQQGGIVAFPTETVYGLGANVFDANAVKKIFIAKGRPADNPLIVHISSFDQLKNLVKDIPEKAVMLIKEFMPGPLTLIFDKTNMVPNIVTGGLSTVAVRMPSNNVALELIRLSKHPIAAPSANKSSLPSPTTARHVYDDLNGAIEYIIDGGECMMGLESTVVDVRGNHPKILRSGALPVENIAEIIGEVELISSSNIALSPGMKYKHYSPKADVYFSAFFEGMEENIISRYDKFIISGKKPVIICLSNRAELYGKRNVLTVGEDYNDYAKKLFASLREADKNKYNVVIAEGVPSKGIGITLINRLLKASGGQII